MLVENLGEENVTSVYNNSVCLVCDVITNGRGHSQVQKPEAFKKPRSSLVRQRNNWFCHKTNFVNAF